MPALEAQDGRQATTEIKMVSHSLVLTYVLFDFLYRRSVLPWITSGLLLVMRKALNDGNSAVQW